MSVVNPTIDDLLAVTEENRFLLCEVASRRARDVNDMMRNQHSRAEQLADVEDISQFMSDEEGHAPNPLSIAFDEIAPRRDREGGLHPGILSFDARSLHEGLGLDDAGFVYEEYYEGDEDEADEQEGLGEGDPEGDAEADSADAAEGDADDAPALDDEDVQAQLLADVQGLGEAVDGAVEDAQA